MIKKSSNFMRRGSSMQVNQINGCSFKSIILDRVSISEIAPRYEDIKKLSEDEDKIDLFIRKGGKNKFLPRNDLFTVKAVKTTENPRGIFIEMCTALPGKKADGTEVSEQLYEAAHKAVSKIKNKLEQMRSSG